MARIWQTTSGRLLHTLKGRRSIQSAFFSPNGKLVVTKSDDPTAQIWESKSGRLLRVLRCRDGD